MEQIRIIQKKIYGFVFTPLQIRKLHLLIGGLLLIVLLALLTLFVTENIDLKENLVKSGLQISALKEANKKLENEALASSNTNATLSNENKDLSATNQTLSSQIDAFAKQAKACQEIKTKLHIK